MPLPINDGTRLARRSEPLRQSYFVKTVRRGIPPQIHHHKMIVRQLAGEMVNSMQNDC